MSNKVKIKCSNCGGIKFFYKPLGEFLAGYGRLDINSYACKDCGHIELFAPELDAYAEQRRIERQEQKLKFEQNKKEEILKIDTRLAALNAIINDENSTIKQVKLAKEEINELTKQKQIILNKRFAELNEEKQFVEKL